MRPPEPVGATGVSVEGPAENVASDARTLKRTVSTVEMPGARQEAGRVPEGRTPESGLDLDLAWEAGRVDGPPALGPVPPTMATDGMAVPAPGLDLAAGADLLREPDRVEGPEGHPPASPGLAPLPAVLAEERDLADAEHPRGHAGIDRGPAAGSESTAEATPDVWAPEAARLADVFRPFSRMLSPAGPLAVEAVEVDRATVVTVFPAGLAPDVRRLLPALLGVLDGPAGAALPPGPRLTLRGTAATLVITPLPRHGHRPGRAVLVTGTVRPGSLGLLELLSRRAVQADCPTVDFPVAVSDPFAHPGLAPIPVPATVRRFSEHLDALGSPSPTALWDPSRAAVLYAFLEESGPSRPAAELAWALYRAGADQAAAAGLGPLHSMALATARSRIVVEPVTRAPGPVTILVVGGPSRGDTGLAHRQIERVAAAWQPR